MFFQPDVMRQPMLPAVRILIDRIPHRTGIDRGRQERIDRERGDTARTETREPLPGSTAIARLVNRVSRGHVEDIRVSRMQCNRDDGLALLLAAERGDQKGE